MKKLFLILAMVGLLATAAAADTLTDADGGTLAATDWVSYDFMTWTLTVIYTDTDGNGTTGIDIPVPTKASFKNRVVASLSTDPGATAPTALYDIAINKKTKGIDVFQGGAFNRSATASETAFPLRGFEHPDDTLQLVVTNQSVAGAVVTMTITVD